MSAVDLVYFQGLSCREAAERLAYLDATVKTRVRGRLVALATSTSRATA